MAAGHRPQGRSQILKFVAACVCRVFTWKVTGVQCVCRVLYFLRNKDTLRRDGGPLYLIFLRSSGVV